MKTEIEINRKVLDKEAILRFLGKLAVEKISYITMNYFGREDDKNFYVRIEEIRENSGKVEPGVILTAKGNFTESDGVQKRTEASLSIKKDEKEKCITLLLLIGLKRRDIKSKVRHEFLVDGIIVTVDEWDNPELGDRLEVEGADENTLKKFVAGIDRYLAKE